LDLLIAASDDPERLLDWMATQVQIRAGGDPARHKQAVRRLRSAGRITILVDGLDHALSRRNLPATLAALLDSEQWRGCPFWISGRPYAFHKCWQTIFRTTEWQWLRVEPLAIPEIRHY